MDGIVDIFCFFLFGCFLGEGVKKFSSCLFEWKKGVWEMMVIDFRPLIVSFEILWMAGSKLK